MKRERIIFNIFIDFSITGGEIFGTFFEILNDGFLKY